MKNASGTQSLLGETKGGENVWQSKAAEQETEARRTVGW